MDDPAIAVMFPAIMILACCAIGYFGLWLDQSGVPQLIADFIARVLAPLDSAQAALESELGRIALAIINVASAAPSFVYIILSMSLVVVFVMRYILIRRHK